MVDGEEAGLLRNLQYLTVFSYSCLWVEEFGRPGSFPPPGERTSEAWVRLLIEQGYKIRANDHFESPFLQDSLLEAAKVRVKTEQDVTKARKVLSEVEKKRPFAIRFQTGEFTGFSDRQ